MILVRQALLEQDTQPSITSHIVMKNTLSLRQILSCIGIVLFAAPITHAGNFVDRHSDNNVEWLEWDANLTQQATNDEKPLFFLVGHFGSGLTRAMAVETFANKTISAMVNDTSIPVAVDINQSPELAAYLFHLAETNFNAADWPVCIWTTDQLAPLAGGGYFPPTDDWGSQGFLSVGRNVHEQWTTDKANFIAAANDRMTRTLATKPYEVSSTLRQEAIATVQTPQPDIQELKASVLFSLTASGINISERLDRIILNAGFDSIEGGFFIGSNDPNWRLPLFQKSASDQALMLIALSKLNQAHPKSGYLDAIRLTSHFVGNVLLKPNGLSRQYFDSFAADETMDMPEGSHFLVSVGDFTQLGEEAISLWGLSPKGNLDEDTDILGIYKNQNVPYAIDWTALSSSSDEARSQISTMRASKPVPASDDIGYTSTNALIVQAYANLASTTGNKQYEKKAVALLKAIEKANTDLNGKRIYNSDQGSQPASSQAYASLIAAYLDIHDITSKKSYLKKALKTLALWQEDSRYSPRNETLYKLPTNLSFAITRDHDIPSVVSIHIQNLKRLAKLTNNPSHQERAKILLERIPDHAPEHKLSLILAVQ